MALSEPRWRPNHKLPIPQGAEHQPRAHKSFEMPRKRSSMDAEADS